MKKILLLLIALFFGANIALAQQDPQITFPIPELGNCANVQTCKVYCDQVENRETCKQFSKSKGLYKDKVDERQVELLSLAKQELGCETITSCREFCSQEENYKKCQAFAQKHGLSTSPKVSAKDEELLSKAKQNLNCDSFEECKTLCDQQDNYTKCAALLQDQVTSDERAMFEKYKPQIKELLGCDSMVTCMAFCINPANSAKCAELGNKIGGGGGQAPSMEPPEVWCPKISSECKWDGTNCFCDGPQSCSQSPGCSWNGQFCNCGETSTTINESPEVWCPKAGPGCAWDGKQCTCFESGTPTQTNIPPPTQEPGEVWCPKIGPYCTWDGTNCTCWDECVKSGGKWTGKVCEYQGGTDQTKLEPNIESPEVSCVRNPDCKWTGETCVCAAVEAPQTEPTTQPAVQGVTKSRTLLQQILEFILRR